ncbi:PREDICTED: MATH domain-containing protein At5g43560-like [Tarenaya hassleriana]|uniref:MATH domain-containing protein At5g43560-like n=1 Tax=Tarenaya hassleriana TaxID=28532 RepID=UPI00053C3458|nr:PREDICTED: MATH domain-containing protein At5g43560-like [Tarenaya hassleriana]
MAEIVNEDSRTQSMVESSNGQRSQSGEAIVEWRSSDQLENGTPSTSPPYWDTDDDDDGQKPSELYGRHTWKIDKFSEINKRELRSSAFAVGGFKWYILIYPQGCDVCNHLSLFLCVANHDKLLPGWSHFAQFTIAVVNKDPKKSKYSDTLHRFWKKEHDWGWKKFMELPKLQDGFIDDSDSLIIKAQVQVIRERVDRPFRCLDCQYRRELVRVYLTNVEQICRRFVEERRSKLGRLIEDKARWTSFCAFWLGMDQNSRRRMSREKMDVILKVVVKHFFIEKEVTSTLVMDSLYSGLKALEGRLSKDKKNRPRLLDAEESPAPIVSVDKDMFVLVDDVLLLLERAALEPLPPKDEKGPQNRTKEGNAGEEFNKEAIERDERRLTELGRRTVEIFVLAHIFSNKIEVAYQEAVALKRQEELIREEEEAWLAESEQRAKRGAEKEKKSKKKQAKQKRNKNKGKEKKKEEKVSSPTDDKDSEENQGDEKKDSLTGNAQSTVEKPETFGDVSDISDSVDGSGEILQPDSEDRDSSPVHWDTDTSEIVPTPTGGSSSRGRDSSISISNGVSERKNQSVMDDSSSTCSNDSTLSGVTNGFHKGNMLNHHYNHNKSPSKGKTQNRASSERCKVSVSEADAVVSSIREAERSGERSPVKNVHNVQMKQNAVNTFDMDRPKEKSAASPRSGPRNPTSVLQPKPEEKGVTSIDTVPARKIASNGPPSSSDQASVTLNIQSRTVTVGPRSEVQKEALAPKPAEKSMAQVTPSISRPSSAPIIPPKLQASPIVSMVQTTSSLARSASSAGRLGPDPSPSSQPFIPQSYKSAIVGNTPAGSSSFNRSSSPAAGVNSLPPYSQPPPSSGSYQSGFPFSLGSRDGSSGGLMWTGGSSSSSSQRDRTISSMNRDALKAANPYTPIGSRSLEQTQSLVTDEFPHLDIINDLLEDEHGSNMMMAGSGFHVVPQLFNSSSSSHYTYHHHHHGTGTELGLSGELLSCRSSRSYSDEGFHHGYGHFDSYMPHSSASASPYGNGQMDGLIPTQWRMANMDLSLRAMRNPDEAAYPPFGSEASNSNPNLSANINGGYAEFRPSKGH